MSDYLDNLISRTLNQTPRVKPRLASLYEPLSGLVSDRVMSQLDVETSAEERSLNREPFQSSSYDPQRNFSLPKLPEPRINPSHVDHSLDRERPGLDSEESRSIPVRGLNVPSVPVPRLIPEPLPRLINEPPSIAAVDSQNVRALQPPNAGVVRPLTSNVEKPAPAIMSSMSEGDKTLASDRRLKSTLVAKPQADVPDNRNISTGTALTRLISTQPKSHQSLDVTSHPNSVSEPTPEGASKISVTIGRVDVRAIFTQSQADRSERPKKSAAMSLDDYLKQRTGGRR